jgi:hypothetical protein
MTIADMVYSQVKLLPDPLAREVLDFVGFLREGRDRAEWLPCGTIREVKSWMMFERGDLLLVPQSLNVVPANAGTHTPCFFGNSAGIKDLCKRSPPLKLGFRTAIPSRKKNSRVIRPGHPKFSIPTARCDWVRPRRRTFSARVRTRRRPGILTLHGVVFDIFC